ncbi:hypothetical protein SB00610_03595 [Klebsiella quasipneumoniae subsp. similipneumoniae]|nr:hypothetical protein SB00610_03595 [Klebsiella quasipneumoniae subsp. similipneumoniae]
MAQGIALRDSQRKLITGVPQTLTKHGITGEEWLNRRLLFRSKARQQWHLFFARQQMIVHRQDMDAGPSRLVGFNNVAIASWFILLR